MIKDFEELSNYSEYPEPEIVEAFTNFVLDNSQSEMRKETFEKLNILSDKQYHTYTQPSNELKEKIQNWIVQNWVDNTNEFLNYILSITYGFALDKNIFEKAFDLIQEEKKCQKNQWITTLQNSDGKNINPWWDLKAKKG